MPSKLSYPFAVKDITSGYGPRRTHHHDGIDFGYYSRNKSVKAAGDGTVTKIEYTALRGHQLEIEHGDGISTRYHMLERGSYHVKVGDRVSGGQEVARVAGVKYDKGAAWTGPHLHFEVRRGGKVIDPRAYIDTEQHRQPALAPAPASGGGFVVKVGVRDERVGRWQRFMNDKYPGYAGRSFTGVPLAIDNHFGEKQSVKWLEEFQERTPGLRKDGWFTWGSGQTWDALVRAGFKG